MSDNKLLGKYEYDPVYLNSGKEAIVILFVWLFFFLWTIPYCWINGYRGAIDPTDLEMVLGMPSWIFWGVAVPWLVADVVTILLAVFYIKDDPLGEADEEADIEEDRAELHASEGKGGEA